MWHLWLVYRWVKYEEDVEEGGERWSKPHVASLSLHSLFELRSGLTSGGVILDMDAQNISQVAGELLVMMTVITMVVAKISLMA